MSEQNDFMQTLFVIDDDAAVRDSLEVLLNSTGFRCLTFVSAQDFLVGGHRVLPRSGCVIVDVRLPDMDGFQLMERLKSLDQFERAKFIGLSGYRDFGEFGARDFDYFLEKPVNTGQLETVLREIAR